MFHLRRFLTIGNPSPQQMALRLLGIGILMISLLLLLNGEPVGPTGIRGDTRPTLMPLQSAGVVEVGASVRASLGEGERHAWELRSADGQRISIRVLSDWDSTLEVFLPGGDQAVAVDFNSGGDYQAYICQQRFFGGNQLRIVVSGYLGLPGRNFGAYELQVSEAPAEC